MKLSFMIKTDDVTNNRATAPNKSVEEMYPLIKEAGYDGVEIMMANPLNIDFAKLQRLSKEYDLPVCALCTGEVYGTEKLSFADPNEKKREEAIRRVKHAMEAAKEFKVPVNIGRVKGMFLDALPPAETIRYSSEGLIACADSNPDVDLILEACCRKFSNFIRSTDEALALIREIGRPNIKMMVDNDHMTIEKEDYKESMKKVKDILLHAHICDSDRKMPGKGNYPLQAYVNALLEIGFSGYLSVESLPTEDPKVDIFESMDCLKKLLKDGKN